MYYLVLVGALAANGLSSRGYPTDAWWQYADVHPVPAGVQFRSASAVRQRLQPILVSGRRGAVLRGVAARAVVAWSAAHAASSRRSGRPGGGRPLGRLESQPPPVPSGRARLRVPSWPHYSSNRSAATERTLSRSFSWGGAAAAVCVALLAAVSWRNPEPQWRSVSFTVFAAFYACAVGLTVVHSGHPWMGRGCAPRG